VQVSRCGLGWQVPGLAHPDAPALEMLAMVLGHGDSSILWQQLREKARLVHSIDAMTWNPGICGLFYVSYLADPGKRAAAERAVISTLNATADRGIGITALAKAVRQAVTAEVNMRKTMSGQAARLGAAEVVVGDLDYNRRYFERLFALRPSDLRRVLRTYLVPERLTVVSSNPQTASVAVVAPAVASAGSLDFIEELLPNGSRLLLQPNRHLPNLHLRLVFAGGPLHEPAGRRGANALMATMLTKDTKVRTAEQVARLIEQAGGRLADFSGNNSFGLYAEVLPADTALAIELLGDGVMRPAFTAARLDVERECALAALRESLDDVVTVGRKKLRGIFFGDHPFAVESCGDEPGLGATRSSDLIALHRRLVVAGNTVLAAAGDFDLKKLAPRLRALLARLPRGIADAAERARSPACGDHVETQPRQQAVVFEAYPGPGVRSADYYVGEVADELFSGMSSNLFEQVREKKSLAYFVRSSRMSGLDTAMFYFFAGTSPERQTEVLAEFAAEIARVKRGGVAADELRRCQTRLKAGRRMSMQANGARAMQAALNAIYGLPVNDWRHYDAKIDAVTLDDLAAFALRYFVPRKRVRLVVRPEAAGGNIRDFP
jgi:zinc protease